MQSWTRNKPVSREEKEAVMRRRYQERNSRGREDPRRGKKESLILSRTQTKKEKKNSTERGDSFSACLLFSADGLQPRGRAYPQASTAVGIYSSAGLPANKTHVDLPRNGEGLGS